MKGFTLIEMMIVVAIITILAAVGIGGMKNMNSTNTQVVEMEDCKQVTTPTRKYWECNK